MTDRNEVVRLEIYRALASTGATDRRRHPDAMPARPGSGVPPSCSTGQNTDTPLRMRRQFSTWNVAGSIVPVSEA
jgi:hypothetical protein